MNTFRAFDRQWPVVCPPASDFYRVVPATPQMSIAFVASFLEAHVVANRRSEFRAAMEAEESLTIDDLFDLVDPMCRATYDGLSYRALSTLLGLWPERRHLHHGRLIAAGRQHGARDLTLYDVFALMWADLDEAARSSKGFDPVDFEESDKLREQIVGLQGRPESAENDLADFRARLGPKKPKGAQRPPRPESAT